MLRSLAIFHSKIVLIGVMILISNEAITGEAQFIWVKELSNSLPCQHFKKKKSNVQPLLNLHWEVQYSLSSQIFWWTLFLIYNKYILHLNPPKPLKLKVVCLQSMHFKTFFNPTRWLVLSVQKRVHRGDSIPWIYSQCFPDEDWVWGQRTSQRMGKHNKIQRI